MFLVNSRLGLFTAALSPEHPFSRSYGVILPSSLTIVRSLALGSSPHLPVLVCGTGTFDLLSGFSWQHELSDFIYLVRTPSQLVIYHGGFAYRDCFTAWTRITNSALPSSFCVPTSVNRSLVVLESQPVVHRLRRSPSA